MLALETMGIGERRAVHSENDDASKGVKDEGAMRLEGDRLEGMGAETTQCNARDLESLHDCAELY